MFAQDFLNMKCLRHKNFCSCVHCSRRNSFIRRKLPLICLLTIKTMHDIIFYISFLQILIPHSILFVNATLRTHSTNKYLIYLEMIILESIWHDFKWQHYFFYYKGSLQNTNVCC